MTRKKYKPSRSMGIFLLVFLGFFFLLVVVERSFQNKKAKQPLPQTMIWDHRGLQDSADSQENTLVSYDRAIKYGAKGVEMDIFYDDVLNGFVVSHDEPYQKQKDSSLLMLDKVLENYGRKIYYWLDLKNLSRRNVHSASEKLNSLLLEYNLTDKVYVESGNALIAHKLSKMENMNVILWIQYSSQKLIVSWLKKYYYKTLIGLGNFSGVSRGYKFADDDFRKTFGRFPCFLFHIYSKTELDSARGWVPESSVLLVDSPFYKTSVL